MNCPKCGREVPEDSICCKACWKETRRNISSENIAAIILCMVSILLIRVGMIYKQIVFWLPLFVTIPVAFSLGLAEYLRSRKNPSRKADRRCAICNVLVSALVFMIFLYVPMAYPNYFGPQSYMSTCLSNVRQMGIAALMYMTEHDGKLPHKLTWNEEVGVYIKDPSIWRCPLEKELPCSYVYNSMLPGSIEEVKIPGRTVVFFEGEYVWNGKPYYIGARRHNGKDVPMEELRVPVSFLDGHAGVFKGIPPLIPPDENNE